MTDTALLADEHRHTPRHDVAVMVLVGLAHGASHFFQLLLPPLFPFLKDEFSVSYTELGLIMTLFYTTSGLLQTPAGFLVDRIGARRVLIGGLTLCCAAPLLYSLAPSYTALLAITLLAGIGNSVFHPADYSILNASISQRRMGRAFSSHTLGGNLGYAVSPALLGTIAFAYGWRSAAVVAGLMGLCILAAVLLRRDLLQDDMGKLQRAANRLEPSGSAHSVMPLFSLPVVMCFIYFLLMSSASAGLQNFLPPTLDAVYSTPLTVATAALTGFLLGSSAGIIVGGGVADRGYSPHRLVTGGLLCASAMMLVVATVPLPNPLLIACVASAGFLQGFTTPSRDLIVRAAAPKGATGRVFGFVYSGLDAGSALSPFLLGFLLDQGRADVVLFVVPGVLLLTILTVLGIHQTRREDA